LNEKDQEDVRSRRSSKTRLVEEDLPESYGNLAKRVYAMAEKEGWSQAKIFQLLKDPAKLVKTLEHVSRHKTKGNIGKLFLDIGDSTYPKLLQLPTSNSLKL
jgi:ribosome-binding protein aMBF1 (putative translation factor)